MTDAVLAAPRVAAALRVLDAVETASVITSREGNREMVHLTSDADWVYWSSLSGLLDALRAVSVEPTP